MLPILLYDNIFRDGTLSASGTSTDDDYDVNYLIDFKSFSKWKAASTSDPWVKIILSAADSPDCLGIYNHNFDEVGGTIKLQHDSNEDDTWTDMETITPNGTLPILIDITTPVSSKRFRIFFDTPTLEPEIAIVFLGTKIEFPFPPVAPVMALDESVRAATEISEAGHTLGSIISHFPINFNQRWEFIPISFFNNTFLPAWTNHIRYNLPFFYAVDLENRTNDIYFVRRSDSMTLRKIYEVLSYSNELVLDVVGISSDENYLSFIES